MKKVITELKQQVESGDYFKEARNWYADKYLGIKNQVFAAFLMFAIVCAAAYLIVDSMMDKYFSVEYPVPLYVEDQVNFRSKIKPLALGYESIDISIARNLISKYVTARETYIYRGLSQDIISENLSAIKSASSRKVFADYSKFMDPQKNPESPILKYKLQTERLIEIKSIKFPRDVSRPSSATIIFEAIERNTDSENSSLWTSYLEFSLSNVTNVLDHKENLSFIVTSYKTKEIKNVR